MFRSTEDQKAGVRLQGFFELLDIAWLGLINTWLLLADAYP